MMLRLAAVMAVAILVFGGRPGDRAFREGRIDDAVAEYRRGLAAGDESAELRYNLGTALLVNGAYEEAREHLEAAARAPERRVSQPAHYNAGNASLEPAFGAPHSAGRAEALERAVAHYKQALRLDPEDLDAKWNLELAQRLLAQQQAGGGGADDPREGGGGGGEDDPAPASPDATPSPADGAGPEPQMTRAEAERILQAATDRERELQHEKLQRAQAPPPNVRDW